MLYHLWCNDNTVWKSEFDYLKEEDKQRKTAQGGNPTWSQIHTTHTPHPTPNTGKTHLNGDLDHSNINSQKCTQDSALKKSKIPTLLLPNIPKSFMCERQDWRPMPGA